MNDRQTKQVIVIRKDLKMRRGKEISQGAHASMGVLLTNINKWIFGYIFNKLIERKKSNNPILVWLLNSFAKITVTVQTEQELIDLEKKAKENKIPCYLITDNGRTEFGGVPTKTSLAIGPWWSDEIDKITGHLPLY